MSFNGLFETVKECYNGFKVGFNHDFWIVKNNAEKMTGAVKNIVRSSSSSSSRISSASNGVVHHGASTGTSGRKSAIDGFKVVGVGFGRTGTYSLGLALNQLGYPSLHTYHLYENSDIIEMWTEQIFRPSIESKEIFMGSPDFDLITSHGYSAAVDFPIALYFEQLNDKYPECKFILTVRQDSETWYRSWRNMAVNIAHTTNIGAGIFKHVRQLSLYLRWLFAIVNKDENILSIPPGQPIPNPDKFNAIQSYEEHNRRVREVIPKERLLEYNVKQGWEPLCDFLQVDKCPDEPFPKTNTALSLKVQNISCILIPLSIILFILFTAFAFGFERLTGRKVVPWLDQRWRRFRWSLYKYHSTNKSLVKRSMSKRKKAW